MAVSPDPPTEGARIFISYSRRDCLELADALFDVAARLAANEFKLRFSAQDRLRRRSPSRRGRGVEATQERRDRLIGGPIFFRKERFGRRCEQFTARRIERFVGESF